VVCESEGVLHSLSAEGKACDLSFRGEGAGDCMLYLGSWDGGGGDWSWGKGMFFLTRFGYGSMMALRDGYSGSLMFFCSCLPR